LRRLDLLQKLYQRITVPQAVADELKAGGDQGEDVPNIREYEWLKVRSVRVPEVITLITDLGAGEAQVLALAIEEPGSLVILDNSLARQIARLRSLRITGTAGVLLKAKHEGHILAVAPLLDRLMQLDFRLSDAVKAKILRLALE
jgi:predicted nucleic acid-binding protein